MFFPEVCPFWILISLHICNTRFALVCNNLCPCLCFILLIIMRLDMSKVCYGRKCSSYSFMHSEVHFHIVTSLKSECILQSLAVQITELQWALAESGWVCFCEKLLSRNRFRLNLWCMFRPHGWVSTSFKFSGEICFLSLASNEIETFKFPCLFLLVGFISCLFLC